MISVQQFVSHLDLEAQGAVLVSKEAFLAFLRERYQGLDEASFQVRRDLEHAARLHASGERIRVDADPIERAAAQAVIYAILRLSDRLRDRAGGRDAVTVASTSNQRVADRINRAVTERARRSLGAKPSSVQARTDPALKTGGAGALERWRAGYNGAGGWATRHDLYPRSLFTVSFAANGRETARITIRADRLETTAQELLTGSGRSRRHVAALASALKAGARVEWRATHPRAGTVARLLLQAARRLAARLPTLSVPPCLDAWLEATTMDAPPIPMIEVVPEVAETGQTLHFEASRRETGYGWLIVDGEVLERVRSWATEVPEVTPDPERDLIRGGTVRRVGKPRGTRALAPHESQVIRLDGRERLCGLGTRWGELWLRGTADPEVMRPIAMRWARTKRG